MSILVFLAAAILVSGLELKLNATEELHPEKGDKIPPFAKTFPGCGCQWYEPRGYWACEGTIAFPEDIQGSECGCCGKHCQKSNRKSDEECLAGGFDQKAEMEAERKRLAELLKGADLLLTDSLPGFIVKVPDKGECTNDLLVKACKIGNGKEKDLTPLCDHTNYASTKRCYTPPDSKFKSKHFSHWSGHRATFNLDVDDEIFYGMCFFTNNGRHTLYPTGNAHAWSQGSSVSPRTGLHKQWQSIPVARMNDGSGALGSWRTICVKQAPTR